MKTSTTKNQMKQITTIFTKKLVALSMLATLTITIGACVAKKTESPIQKAKIQLETLGIDEGKAFFVTPSGKKTNDGSSWKKAKDLQSAIDEAATDANKKFVLVAQGSYYADPNKTDVTKTFILKDGVKIYGGFDVDAKKLTRYKDASILEGKLSSSLNSKQILKGENLSAISILDGFLIQNALNGDQNAKGAGLYLENSSPQLKNLTFNNNKLTGYYAVGAAIYNYNNSNPSISNSSFSNNSAGSYGGAIYNENNSSPSISNSSFSNNSVNGGFFPGGGAIYNYNKSNPSISNSTFSKNFAKYGGAIYNNNSSPSISNSSFSNNFAETGGVIYNYTSSPSISNASFSNNSAETGGAIFNDDSSPKIYNSILWNNKDKQTGTEAINNIQNFDGESQPIIKNSILNADSIGGYNNNIDISTGSGKGNNQTPAAFSIDADGKVASASQVFIKDKGDNALYKEVTKKEASEDKDLAGNSRLHGSTIDIGAYELQE